MIYIIGCISIIVGVFLDQFTKYLAVTHLQEKSIPIIKDVFQLHYLENHGAAFGILQNQQWFFLIATIITLGFIIYIYIRLPHNKHFLPMRVCLISIVTGAIGNMIDRIRLKYVIDFLYFELIDFPIFNVADIFASVATVVLIVLFLFYYKDEDFETLFCLFKRNKKQEKQSCQ